MEAFKKGVELKDVDGKGMKVGIVTACWNKPIVAALADRCEAVLLSNGVCKEDILRDEVPGSFELPFAAKSLISRHEDKLDAVVCIGVLIKGDTMHFEYICSAASQGLMQVGLDTGVPVIFGVLTCLDEHQAQARAGLIDGGHNHGEDWARAALEMGKRRFRVR